MQGSPRDSETDGKGLLPKMQSINWNQDLSGTPISLHETFDSSDSTHGAGRGLLLHQAVNTDPAAFSICKYCFQTYPGQSTSQLYGSQSA